MSEKEKLMPYQQRFPDGFITNKFLEKPKTKGGIIYSAIDNESITIHGDVFVPTWNTTDHLHFACQKCKSVADVLRVELADNYSSDARYALFFYLGCRRCGATGQRKIYLDRRAKACVFQHTYDESKIYLYEKEDQPYSIIACVEKRLVKGETQKQEKG